MSDELRNMSDELAAMVCIEAAVLALDEMLETPAMLDDASFRLEVLAALRDVLVRGLPKAGGVAALALAAAKRIDPMLNWRERYKVKLRELGGT